MDIGVPVEARAWRKIIKHGVWAGLLAGVALGAVQMLISAVFQESALTPFRLVCALLWGEVPRAAATGWVLLVGGGLHLALAMVYGVIFSALLSLGWQLSARAWVLLAYGLLFGFFVYEVNFLAVLPGIYPALAPEFGLENQLWKGIAAYALVYGPVMAGYLIVARPGVCAEWAEEARSKKAAAKP